MLPKLERTESGRQETAIDVSTGWLILLRVFAVPSVLLAIVGLVDLAGPPTRRDLPVVSSKYTVYTDARLAYYVKAAGKYHYDEAISRRFYKVVRPGDQLEVALSNFFSEWKSAKIIRGGRVVLTEPGWDTYYVAVFSLLFFAPGVCFLRRDLWLSRRAGGQTVVATIVLFEVLAILLWAKLGMVVLGWSEKM